MNRSSSKIEVWQVSLKNAFKDPQKLITYLKLPKALIDPAQKASQLFPLLAPKDYVKRIKKGDPNDPLLLQILPLKEELIVHPSFHKDPVGDLKSSMVPGILQKYNERVLLITTGACAIHCRYCFRRHFPYSSVPVGIKNWISSLSKIKDNPEIEEIILSGGDPLVLTDKSIAHLLQYIETMPYISRIRFHTRLPIVLPNRITSNLLHIFKQFQKTIIIVVHANHPNEIQGQCVKALQKLKKQGLLLLNQTVLLKNINDSSDIQQSLNKKLIQYGVLPYYLHQFDRVQNAAHFEVPISNGLQIMKKLQQTTSGYLIPKYVQEIPGYPSKKLVF